MGTLSLSDYEDVIIPVPWGHISGRWYGNRKERPILAIHGWLDNLGTFDTLIPLLPDYLGVLCIDLPGHGRSSWLPAGMHYDVGDYVLCVKRIMEEYKWKRVSLMGHSMGAVIVSIFTALKPHLVDMTILLDIVVAPFQYAEYLVELQKSYEKHLIEDERAEQQGFQEPPSYTMEELRNNISRASSLPVEYAHHLLDRSVVKSKLYPDKFYFSRDGRAKYYNDFIIDAGLAREITICIKQTPYLIIKASKSNYINHEGSEALSILKAQNKNFQYYEVSGTHHAHLHNAAECGKYIVPFIRRYHPPTKVSGSVALGLKKASSSKL